MNRNLPQPKGTRIAKPKTKLRRFEGYIKWGWTERVTFNRGQGQADLDESQLPPQLRMARDLWSRKKFGKARALILPLLRATFVADNVDDIEQLMGGEVDDIEARRILIRGMDFSAGLIPLISASANFQIPILTSFEMDELDDWEDEHTYLDWALSFQWRFGTDDFFILHGEESGFNAL